MHNLATFPTDVRRWMESVPAELLTKRPAAGGLALVENAWHLADLEAEGYGVRLRRLLSEISPTLPDFQGDVIAKERDYVNLPLAPALERFARARAENLALIENATEQQRQRTGEQEGVGTVNLERVVAMMAEHDEGHAEEIAALRRELGID
jgi:hypothetical protein